jgi:ketosteroid isomerase-like protein
MSEENVQAVLNAFRAFQRRDEQTLFAGYAPDIEWDLSGYSPWTDQALFRGHDGIRSFFRQWLADFDHYETEARDPVDVEDRVVVTVLDRAIGKRSGAQIERVHAQIWTFRDGLVARIQVLDDRSAALRAVGLEEQP